MNTNPRKLRSTNRRKKKSEQMRHCEQCGDPFGYHAATGRFALAADVHHKDEIANAPHKAFDDDNLICVCKLCHKALHGAIDAQLQIEDELLAAARSNGDIKPCPLVLSKGAHFIPTRGKGGEKLSKFHSRPNAVTRKKIHGIFTGGGLKIKDGVLIL